MSFWAAQSHKQWMQACHKNGGKKPNKLHSLFLQMYWTHQGKCQQSFWTHGTQLLLGNRKIWRQEVSQTIPMRERKNKAGVWAWKSKGCSSSQGTLWTHRRIWTSKSTVSWPLLGPVVSGSIPTHSEIEGSATTTSSSCCVSGLWYSGEGGFINLTSSLPFSTLRRGKRKERENQIYLSTSVTPETLNSFIRTYLSLRPLDHTTAASMEHHIQVMSRLYWICCVHSLQSSWTVLSAHTLPDMTAMYFCLQYLCK